MKQTLESSLKNGGQLQLQTADALDSPEAAFEMGKVAAVHPAIASVSLVSDAQGTRANLRVWERDAQQWKRHLLRFQSGDSASERGRAAAFSLLTMFPEVSALARAHPPLEGVVNASSPTTPPPRAAPPTAADVGGRKGWRPSAELAGGAALGLAPHAPAATLSVGARSCSPTGMCLLGQVGVRRGDFGPAELRWNAIRVGMAAEKGTKNVALGGGLFLDRDVLERRTADGRQTLRRWNGGALVWGELRGNVGPRTGLFIRGGPQVTLGTTRVFVNGDAVSRLPRVFAFSEAGVRWHFH